MEALTQEELNSLVATARDRINLLNTDRDIEVDDILVEDQLRKVSRGDGHVWVAAWIRVEQGDE